MVGRVIGTVVTTLIYGWVMMAYAPQATLITGQAAGGQFDNTDTGYLTAVYTMNFFSAFGTITAVLFVGALALIWYKPLRDAIRRASQALALLLAAAGALLIATTDGRAFFEKVDRTEIYPVLPNQSAFWIPEVGAVKDKQIQIDSEAFLNENKVQLNRFQVPHQKLTGSAGNSVFSGWDYYVPAGRLIIVDRTPFSREWVDAQDPRHLGQEGRVPLPEQGGAQRHGRRRAGRFGVSGQCRQIPVSLRRSSPQGRRQRSRRYDRERRQDHLPVGLLQPQRPERDG
jgi:hypothetical protein